MDFFMQSKKSKIAAGVFKTRCLQLIDEVNQHRNSIIITKHGKPLAMLVPIKQDKPSLFGCLKDGIVIKSDIVSSTGEEWDADS